MPDANVTLDQQALLKKARQGSLLRRYASGQSLSHRQLKELRGLIPNSVIDSAPRERASYAKNLADYEDVYGVKVRQIKNWIATGRDALPTADLPPLDDPAKMKDWWMRHMTQRVPDILVKLAAPAGAPPVTVFPQPQRTSGSAPAAAVASPLGTTPPAPAGLEATGFSAALKRIRTAEAAQGRLHAQLQELASGPNLTVDQRSRLLAECEQARRAHEELLGQLRDYEKDAEKILAASGRIWNADEVSASMFIIHRALVESMRLLWRRMRAKIEGVPADQHDKLFEDELERMFAALRANKFTAPVDFPHEPAA